MEKTASFLFSAFLPAVMVTFALCGEAFAAERLSLWITTPIGATDAKMCHNSATTQTLPTVAPTLSEQDVTRWDRSTAHWTLNPKRFAHSDVVAALGDHCFVLAIDGRLIETGVVLSSSTARSIDFASLLVYERDGQIDLMLTSNVKSQARNAIHVDALDAVLQNKVH